MAWAIWPLAEPLHSDPFAHKFHILKFGYKEIIKEACGLGYRAMRLDTSVRQAEANALYQRLGFQTIKPYYEVPEDVRNWLVFMELKL